MLPSLKLPGTEMCEGRREKMNFISKLPQKKFMSNKAFTIPLFMRETHSMLNGKWGNSQNKQGYRSGHIMLLLSGKVRNEILLYFYTIFSQIKLNLFNRQLIKCLNNPCYLVTFSIIFLLLLPLIPFIFLLLSRPLHLSLLSFLC